MMGDASLSGELRNTGSAAASSAWECLLLFILVFAGVVVGVGLILAMPQSLPVAGPATPVLKILTVQWYRVEQELVPTHAA
jgi:hypothetical protein